MYKGEGIDTEFYRRADLTLVARSLELSDLESAYMFLVGVTVAIVL